MKKSTGILAAVDLRTRLAGENRMELLMFRLAGSEQIYGINVFKVKEVMHCPKLIIMPGSHAYVLGLMDFRGASIPVIDFNMAIWKIASKVTARSLVIIAEHNRSVQALLVDSVDRIVNLNWDEILVPPVGARAASGSYLTAVTSIEDNIIEIIDVERIVEEIQPCSKEVSRDVKTDITKKETPNKEKIVIIADDSAVARKQIQRCIDQIGFNYLTFNDGKQTLDYLKSITASGNPASNEILMIISDVEMPEMDGYTLTTEIRKNENLKSLYVILHTSLSGVFNEALVKKVGANNFIAKFQPDVLAKEVQVALDYLQENAKEATSQ